MIGFAALLLIIVIIWGFVIASICYVYVGLVFVIIVFVIVLDCLLFVNCFVIVLLVVVGASWLGAIVLIIGFVFIYLFVN